ncbi:MAG: site-2 protease family protein [Caulobacteraceae bacterium]|nr:site-2 protease family protein [Caulobacteraceae bacterium]
MFLQNALLVVAPFLAVITVIVTIHELGHFLTARAFGVAIDRFSIGFGRALVAWKDRSGVEWRLGWAPLGGYVRFAGDENAASVPDKEDLESLRSRIVASEGPGAELKYLHFKPLWQRALIVAAGPAANFLLSITIFSLIFATIGDAVSPFRVAAVQPSSAAARAGFRAGDRIVATDGHPVRGFEDLVRYVVYRDGVPIDFTVRRGESRVRITATPGRQQVKSVFGGAQTAGLLGITPQADGPAGYVHYGPIAAVGMGVRQTWQVLDTTVFYLGRIFTGHVSANQLHSFVGIARASGAITKQAIDQAPHDPGDQVLGVVVNLLGFAALVSVSIGLMNLLPMPVLDGGHLLFYAYEWVARRPVAARVQAVGYRVGLALLMCLMLFATWNDLHPLRVIHFFGSLFS